MRDFDRAPVARFGGPAGSIETYLEVPFTLDERTSIPDGVIRVARGGRIWTALLEVKTGSSPLRPEQVERYLDLARHQRYDALISQCCGCREPGHAMRWLTGFALGAIGRERGWYAPLPARAARGTQWTAWASLTACVACWLFSARQGRTSGPSSAAVPR